MIKNQNSSAPTFWWYFFFLILTIIPAVQSCQKSIPQRSTPCDQNISTDLPIDSIKISIVPKWNQRNVCPFADKCLQITTGAITDYARLYYKNNNNAGKTILHGYLICGGDGVSVTGTTASFNKFYVTLISTRPRNNNRFFVDESGSTSIVLIGNDLSSDIDYTYEKGLDAHNPYESNIVFRGKQNTFDSYYPKLPSEGYVLNIVVFYDRVFQRACFQKSKSPDEMIEQIFNEVDNYFKDESLSTKFHINLSKIIHRDVIWNNAKRDGTEASLKIQNRDNKEDADIFVHLGLMNNVYGSVKMTPGKASKLGMCFPNKRTCSGVCSRLKYEQSLVAQGDVDNLPLTAYIITHEIGHLLGFRHDFQDLGFRRPQYSIVTGESCKGVNGIMESGLREYNNLKWSICSNEYLRIYHKEVKDVANRFCLEPYHHTKTVECDKDGSCDLNCDITTCDGKNMNFVKWYLDDGTRLGQYFALFDEIKVEPEYSGDISMLCQEEKVILRTSKYAKYMQNAYCIIEGENLGPFCKIKQTFEIKITTAPRKYKHQFESVNLSPGDAGKFGIGKRT